MEPPPNECGGGGDGGGGVLNQCYVPNNPQYGIVCDQNNGCCPDPCCATCHWTQQNQHNSGTHQEGTDFIGHGLTELEHGCVVEQRHNEDCTGILVNHVPDSDEVAADGSSTDLCDLPALNPSPQNDHHWHETDQVPEDMGTFTMPLDLEPLPTLFPFSPPAAQYKHEIPQTQCKLEQTQYKPTHDVADVLLSLKHAVVHPGQTQGVSGNTAPYHHHYHQPGTVPTQPAYQQHFTYTVHPPPPPPTATTQLVSPSGTSYVTDQLGSSVFPSMSVNVSMNMTYHHQPTVQQNNQIQQPQYGLEYYTAPCAGYAAQGLVSPPIYHGPTYSFTADFRPQADQTQVRQQPPSQLQQRRSSYGHHHHHQYQKQHDQLNGDLNSSENRPNLCRICGKTYARPSTLKTHLRTHSGEKPYRCTDCNKSFSQAANLTAHVRTHSGEKPFRCPICDRRFSQSSSVTTHVRTHSGERPYRCRACKKAFSDSSTLTKHLRTHSGEKPYQCKLCLLRFSQSGNLNRHMRVHGAQAQAQTHQQLLA